MDLTTLLRPEAVKVFARMTSKKRLFQDLGEIAHAAYGIDAAAAIEALQERESLGPTGVGNGIALPHARLGDLDGVHGLFIRVEKPFDFASVDHQPVDLIFALLAPKDAGVEHLKALALVSRSMRDGDLCAKLRANTDETALHALLTDGPAIRAA